MGTDNICIMLLSLLFQIFAPPRAWQHVLVLMNVISHPELLYNIWIRIINTCLAKNNYVYKYINNDLLSLWKKDQYCASLVVRVRWYATMSLTSEANEVFLSGQTIGYTPRWDSSLLAWMFVGRQDSFRINTQNQQLLWHEWHECTLKTRNMSIKFFF